MKPEPPKAPPAQTVDRTHDRPTAVATLGDVAKRAGVSPMTVSRVINADAGVREATRERVERAVRELRYQPNQAARRLVGSELIRIGVIYSNPSAGYLSEMLVGVLQQASRSHVQLVVEKCDVDEDEVASILSLVRHGVHGLILPPPLCDAKPVVDALCDSGTPVVAIACGMPDDRISAIGVDDFKAAFEMTQHLLNLGHTRIGFIVGHPNQTASDRRKAGYIAALESAGVSCDEELMVQGLFNYRSGLDAAETLLSLEQRPTAVFASNDDMAAAAVAVAHRFGLDVPGDLTVAGFDDAALASAIWPELTTVRQPIAEMSAAAVELLTKQIRAARENRDESRQHVRVDYTIVRRRSDAAPRARPPLRPQLR